MGNWTEVILENTKKSLPISLCLINRHSSYRKIYWWLESCFSTVKHEQKATEMARWWWSWKRTVKSLALPWLLYGYLLETKGLLVWKWMRAFQRHGRNPRKFKILIIIILREITRKERMEDVCTDTPVYTSCVQTLCIKTDFTHCCLLFTYTFNVLFSWLVLFNSNDTCLPFVFSDFLYVNGFPDRHPRLTLWSILYLRVAPRLPAEWKS